MQELFTTSALQLARRVRAREISCVELLQAHLQRVQRLNPVINAVVVMQEEVALQRARDADAALAQGEHWGPLHGLPMTVKEAFDVVGLPTTWGFEKFRDNIATQNATMVQRLLDAGAVIYGKTNVPVALADWQSFNPIYGTSHNPWDVARSPGGSSGGSAAALAAGLSTLELGSDIGSSIRNPAHYCGVWGHKPTWGVLPSQGHQLPGDVCADNTDIGAVGPLARSAHDLTLAMEVLAAPLSAYGPMGRVPVQWRDSGLPARQMRVAVMLDEPRSPVDDSVRMALERLVAFLRSQGVHSTAVWPYRPSSDCRTWSSRVVSVQVNSWAGGNTWSRSPRLSRYSTVPVLSIRQRSTLMSSVRCPVWKTASIRPSSLRSCSSLVWV